MYNYKFSEGHYVVTIDEKYFVIDTGSEYSFMMNPYGETITIDGVSYKLPGNLGVNRAKVEKLVQHRVDGFIGEDIIQTRSLTIDKSNMTISFEARIIEGNRINYSLGNYDVMIVCLDNPCVRCMIDTGAKVGYGTLDLFNGKISYGIEEDYNPGLEELESPGYHYDIIIGGKKINTDVCYNNRVESCRLNIINVDMVIGPDKMFDEVLVIDAQRRQITFR